MFTNEAFLEYLLFPCFLIKKREKAQEFLLGHFFRDILQPWNFYSTEIISWAFCFQSISPLNFMGKNWE